MTRFIILILLFLAFLPLAGCSDGPGPSPEAGLAVYLNEMGDRASYEFRLPTTVRTANNEYGQAYALVGAWTWRLDGAFQVVRIDHPCGGRDCTYLDWGLAGTQTPLGIGLLAQWNSVGRIVTVNSTSIPVDAPTVVKRHEGTTVLEVKDPPSMPPGRSIAGRYEFRQSQVFPERIQIGNQVWTLQTLESKGPVEAIPIWPRPTVGSDQSPFPVDTAAIPGFDGMVPAEALASLRRDNQEADAILNNGGCVIDFTSLRLHQQSSGFALPGGRSNTVQIDTVLATGDGMAKKWTQQWGRDTFGAWGYTQPSGPSQAPLDTLPGGCEAVSRSPGAQISPAAFMVANAKLPISSPTTPNLSAYFHQGTTRATPPQQGWAHYALLFYPPGSDPESPGFVRPLNQIYNASSSAWVRMEVPASDLARMDAAV